VEEVVVVAVSYVYSPEQYRDYDQSHRKSQSSDVDLAHRDASQEALTAELGEEQERNSGHLAEIDDIQKGYDEKLAAFEVIQFTFAV